MRSRNVTALRSRNCNTCDAETRLAYIQQRNLETLGPILLWPLFLLILVLISYIRFKFRKAPAAELRKVRRSIALARTTMNSPTTGPDLLEQSMNSIQPSMRRSSQRVGYPHSIISLRDPSVRSTDFKNRPRFTLGPDKKDNTSVKTKASIPPPLNLRRPSSKSSGDNGVATMISDIKSNALPMKAPRSPSAYSMASSVGSVAELQLQELVEAKRNMREMRALLESQVDQERQKVLKEAARLHLENRRRSLISNRSARQRAAVILGARNPSIGRQRSIPPSSQRLSDRHGSTLDKSMSIRDYKGRLLTDASVHSEDPNDPEQMDRLSTSSRRSNYFFDRANRLSTIAEIGSHPFW